MKRETLFTRGFPVLRAADLAASEAFYCGVLGFEKEWEYNVQDDARNPGYLCFSRNKIPVHLSTMDGECRPGTMVYFEVSNIDALREEFRQAGLATIQREPVDEPWGLREMYVLDPDGNVLRFGELIESESTSSKESEETSH